MVKTSVCNAGDLGLIPGREDPWRRQWQPTAVLLPRKFHGWRSLMGYSLCGRKESDTTEQLHFNNNYRQGAKHFIVSSLLCYQHITNLTLNILQSLPGEPQWRNMLNSETAHVWVPSYHGNLNSTAPEHKVKCYHMCLHESFQRPQ